MSYSSVEYEIQYFSDKNPEVCGYGPRGDHWWPFFVFEDGRFSDYIETTTSLLCARAKLNELQIQNPTTKIRLVEIERIVIDERN